MTTHEVLVAARNTLDRNGWIQRGWGCVGAPRCAVGAISEAKGSFHVNGALDALALAAGVIREGEASTGADVVNWNNAPDRTKAEVLAAFDKAIAATAPAPDFDSLRVPVEAA